MKYYIPTYEDCIEIVNNNPDMYFYERRYVIDSYKLSTFGYRYASYNNFILPILDNWNISALELKGITYVFDDNGDYKHYLLLPKFWEINQYSHCSYDLYKNEKIKNITTKEDGHLISFLYLPNGELISFDKHGIDQNVNLDANEFLKDKNYYNFIKKCLDNDIQPIFEHVNQTKIVKYGKNDLILLKLRNRLNGKFLDISDFNTDGIKVVNEIDSTLDNLLIRAMQDTEIEGWVVHFESDILLKVKTKWWRNKKNEKIL